MKNKYMLLIYAAIVVLWFISAFVLKEFNRWIYLAVAAIAILGIVVYTITNKKKDK